MKTKFFLLFMSLAMAAHPSTSASEPAPDGISDVWKLRYDAQTLVGTDDSDHDGVTNAAEAAAGTDPLDPLSCMRANIGNLIENEAVLDITSQPGKCYQLFTAASPGGPWTPAGDPFCANDYALRIPAPRIGDSMFYRVGVGDCDTDGDGLSNWEELQLFGFDPNNGDSFSSGIEGNDLAVAAEMLASPQVTVTVAAPIAYEKEGTHAVVTFTRASAVTYPLTLFLKLSGSSDPAKSSAGSNDFILQDANGGPISHRLVIPAGMSSADLHVVPVGDTLREVPEKLHISISQTLGGTVTIRDAMPTPANQTVFIANLRPIFGTSSVGSGTAVIRLSGDNDIANVILSFWNLKSSAIGAEIQAQDGTLLESIHASEYAGHAWSIRASGPYVTDQSLFDAICAGGVGLSIKTEANADGEIEGGFVLSSGSDVFQPPSDPGPIAPLADQELDRDIVRFLTQATFGPTPDDIAALKALVASHSGDRIAAFGDWIDQQFALPSPSLLAYTVAADRQEIEASAALPPDHPRFNANFEPYHYNRLHGWWLLARHAPDQLRERAAFALSEIFVISDLDPVIHEHVYGTAHYYDMLREGASGSFRVLLANVITHPIMGQYLSHLRNEKAVRDAMGNVVVSPDENLARECMQLFSLGLVELFPDGSPRYGSDGLSIPTYDQRDIADLSRAFTGWSFSVIDSPATSDNVVVSNNFFQGNGIRRHEDQWTHPLTVFPEHHDTDVKVVLGTTIPAGQTGEQDLAVVLDRLASHPNTAPFISRRLIQRLVTANPSAAYLYRVSRAFTASGGNLAVTIKAILLDPEARSLDTALGISGFGKKREPILRYLAFLRAVDGKSQMLLSDLTSYGYPDAELAKFPVGTTVVRLSEFGSWPTQTPQSAPSVFNWFLPDHMPAGLLASNGLVSPEFQILNEYSVFQDINFINYLIFGKQYAPSVPGQELPPYNYAGNASWLRMSYTAFEAPYMAVVDTNGDGEFNNLDTATFNNPASIAAACEALLDQMDLMLCAGSLKARYGATRGQPRQIILDTIISTDSGQNNNAGPGYQAALMRGRIRVALWLVMCSPDFAIQK
ncbi:MAG: DUF1800 family protein [Luteolibacter sp.]